MITLVDDERWDTTLGGFGSVDVYWTRAYCLAAAELDGGRPLLLRHDWERGTNFIALVVRDGGAANTPYGYGGPVGFPVNADAHGPFWSGLLQWCAEHAIKRLLVRYHPLFPAHQFASLTVGSTAVLPTPPRRDLMGQMRASHRNKVRKAERAGANVIIRRAPRSLSAFSVLYAETMDRVNARTFYRFAGPYWQRLQSIGESLMSAEVYLDGTCVAASLNLLGADWIHYHLSAGSSEGRSIGAAQLMLLKIADWSQRHNFRGVHLGGGVGSRDDSLLHFKHGFAPLEPLRPFAISDISIT